MAQDEPHYLSKSLIFSPLVDGVRGKAGSAVFVQGRTGPVLRPRVKPANPKTAAQQGVKNNLGLSSKQFKALGTPVVAQWKAYGLTITKHNQRTGKAYNSTAINAYNALSAKFYQVNPTGTFPTAPPAAPFNGDSIGVSVAAGPATLIFTATGANGTNIKTELLLQPLKSKNRTPTAKGYRTKTFMAFVAGTLSVTVSTPSGWYVPAYRFVNTQTGQASPLVILPPIQAT